MKDNRLPPDMDPEELNFPDTLRLTVKSASEAREDAVEAADTIESEDEPVAVRTFADVTEFRKLLTDRRVEVIQTIMDTSPASIQELADQLERNYPEVHEDVEILAEYGIVYYREDSQAKPPYIPYKRVDIDGTVAEATPA